MTRICRPKQVATLILLQLLVLSSPSDFGGVHCSSSYIDDYILPTAKIALNRIQQSLSSPSLGPAPDQLGPPSSSSANKSTLRLELNNLARARDASQEPDASSRQASSTPAPAIASPGDAPEEPNKSEFVNLEVRPDGSGQLQSVDVSAHSGTTSGPRERPAPERASEESATVVSSTESSPEDPTAASDPQSDAGALKDDAAGAPDPKAGPSADPDAALKSKDARPPEDGNLSPNSLEETATQQAPTTSSGAPAASSSLGAGRQPDATASAGQSSKSAEEAVRETELEAIAAVDASIAFGDGQLGGATDACYDEYGNARFCEPEFENVAFERPVEVSSECGHPPSRFCTTNLNERNDQIRNCHICDSQHPKKRHPAAYLTDLNNPNSPTCWVSAPISANASDLQERPAQPVAGSQPVGRDNVTLTLNLEKRYEITYVSLQFCSLRPDSLAIWKSADFAKSWQPYQFYSSQCARVYDRAPAPSAGAQLNRDTGQLEATCVNGSSSQATVASTGRIAFSTLSEEKAPASPGAPPQDKPPALLDWMAATNIKIVLDRHQASWIQSSLAHSHHHLSLRRLAVGANATQQAGQSPASNSSGQHHARPAQAAAASPQASPGELENSLTSPSDTYNFALSDLTVGARCKCNGHASRCVHGHEGKLQCDCQHNTDGPDCERCLPLHHDRPWQRATQANANPCQPCNCNGHSRRCRFDPELYLLSGKRSGGVCIDCKDNTTGRHCNYCREGYTRDHSRPMSDREACKPCDCHPVGSLGKVCNHTTGQCPCKEGVTGPECTRCAPGYQQSSSPSEPCIGLPENDINYEPSIEVASDEAGASSVVSHQASGDQEPSLAPDDSGGATQGPAGGAGKQPRAGLNPDDNNLLESVVNSAEEPPGPQASAPTLDSFHRQSNQFRSLGDDLVDSSGRRPQWPLQMRPHLNQHHHQDPRQPGASQWHNKYKPNGWREYSNSGVKPARPLWPQTFDGLPGGQPADFDELEVMPGRNDYQARQRPSYSAGYSSNGYAAHMNFRPQAAVRPIASLDHNEPPAMDGGDQANLYSDELLQLGVYGNSQAGGYGAPPASRAPDEPADESNRIQRPLRPSASQQHPGGIRAHYQSHKHRADWPLPGHHRSQPNFNAVPQAAGKLNNKVLCSDCQSRIKKLSTRQFCHLDYSIRATVLSRRSSSDWTRIDVEILDIFKSPSAGTLQTGAGSPADASSQSGDQRDGPKVGDMQADEPLAPRTAAGLPADLDPDEEPSATSGVAEPKLGRARHRLKIGSVQSLWVPTEDVACKCPRLKVHSTYLLMGLVDARENSPTSIQLDRHGVALTWRASLQEKLIKYQRLHSDGRC